jgi:hypothetical protein
MNERMDKNDRRFGNNFCNAAQVCCHGSKGVNSLVTRLLPSFSWLGACWSFHRGDRDIGMLLTGAI